MPDELAPPRKSIELEDPGAKELAESSDEHFSDASEGQARRSTLTSPIPITRVERVDDEPAHGEVPGTDAYNKRTQDAVPDEVEIVPDGMRSRSASRVSVSDRPLTPGGTPIPKTIVEKIDPDKPSYGDVPGTLAHQQRLADATPDVIVRAPEPPQRNTPGSPTSHDRSPINPSDEAAEAVPEADDDFEPQDEDFGDDAAADGDDDGFGDFDDFEEGEEGADDFGDFDDGFQQGENEAETTFVKPPDQPPVPAPSPGPPVLDFGHVTSLEDMVTATQPYLDEIYPLQKDIPSISTDVEATRSIFLSERSHSLWTQLVAPPPLQPPDWVRSRIRRLFLVSLGVPVDLDEILPASKQKKLILPSIHIPGDRSPRPSSDGRNGDAALEGFTDEELRMHIDHLKALQERAKEVFVYWQTRMESALGDKDAFEQVIESLVAHAKKLR
ncbi:hypothetical protein HRS9122_08287 [Pyrenophora teres f. teres]|nr:hypothetical protein HRS9122_08287 [Pyrenophora teres f. teres]